MQVKGTAVKSTKDFVRDAFLCRFDEWIEALPDKSREIIYICFLYAKYKYYRF
jgi:hypothetical protein